MTAHSSAGSWWRWCDGAPPLGSTHLMMTPAAARDTRPRPLTFHQWYSDKICSMNILHRAKYLIQRNKSKILILIYLLQAWTNSHPCPYFLISPLLVEIKAIPADRQRALLVTAPCQPQPGRQLTATEDGEHFLVSDKNAWSLISHFTSMLKLNLFDRIAQLRLTALEIDEA